MKPPAVSVVLCWIICLGCTLPPDDDPWLTADWTLAKARDGVEVYTASLPGSDFLAFKAVAMLDVTLEAVLAEILDYAAYPDWYANCRAAEMVSDEDPLSPVLRTVVDAPFPLSDRDAINQVVVERAPRDITLHLINRPDAAPTHKGVVRMQVASGFWRLEQTPAGIRVTHAYHADPRARVPAWMVNRFVVDGPLQTLSRLRERARG